MDITNQHSLQAVLDNHHPVALALALSEATMCMRAVLW